MKQRISLVKLAQQTIAKKLKSGDIAIDATVGNGFDTLFLAQQVSKSGTVYGFDIQTAAIENTRLKLAEQNYLDHVTLICDDHAHMLNYIEAHHINKVKAIMFNLGYLPSSDKHLITQTENTLAALNSALTVIGPNATISIIAYPGHDGGQQETDAVIQWSQTIDPEQYHIELIIPAPDKANAPQLLFIDKQQ